MDWNNYTVDKSMWLEGPWTDEPDFLEWSDETTGVPCRIVRHSIKGYLCGYVGVREDSRWFKQDFLTDCDALHDAAYSCISFSGFMRGDIVRVWWFGFDCGHLNDIIPAHPGMTNYWQDDQFGATYKDVDFVKQRLVQLASAIIATGEKETA